jgi:4-hydroxybenzoate polyprenyltransferase
MSLLNWLVLTSVLIAAGGYVINDYFDLNIDRINKPQKLVIDRFISRRWAMFLHLILSSGGIIISAYLAFKLNNLLIFVFNLISVFFLFVYSSTFKKKLLSGNVIIAALSAWVIMVLFVAMCQWNPGTLIPEWNTQLHEVYKIALIYSVFAFIVSLIREVVKDMEDEDGDKKNGCKTMPIVWGIKSTKVFVGVWILVLFGLLIVLLFNLIISRWIWGIIYILIVLLPFLVRIYMDFSRAQTKKQYAALSREVKLFMLAGILSMLIFNFYQ